MSLLCIKYALNCKYSILLLLFPEYLSDHIPHLIETIFTVEHPHPLHSEILSIIDSYKPKETCSVESISILDDLILPRHIQQSFSFFIEQSKKSKKGNSTGEQNCVLFILL